MFKIVSVCAALILAAITFSTSADARNGHGGGRGGSFGGGVSVGGHRGPGVSGFRGPAVSGARYQGGMYRSGAGSGRYVYGGSRYGGRYASGYGYRYGYRRHGYGYGYWPWAVGAGLAVAATWPYYADYGYDDCVQWRPGWGWVNVCGYPYGGYYPY